MYHPRFTPIIEKLNRELAELNDRLLEAIHYGSENPHLLERWVADARKKLDEKEEEMRRDYASTQEELKDVC